MSELFASGAMRRHWALDPAVVHLNHGGFGAPPRWVLDAQQQWRAEIERNPTDFLTRRLPGLLSDVRHRLADFLNADADGLAFVPNATTGMQTALSCLDLGPDDEVLTTDQTYGAVKVQLRETAARTGCRIVVAPVPLPLTAPREVVDALTAYASSHTRLVVVDHVVSASAIVMPVEAIIAEFHRRGVPVMVDGAHALAMLPVDLTALGADWWTGNLHKWLAAPRSAAVLYAAPAQRARLRPLVASHFHDEGLHAAFDWTGTYDPTAILAAPAALDFWAALDWDAVRHYDRELAAYGARVVADALGTDVPVPDELSGSMRVVTLPRVLSYDEATLLGRTLLHEHGVEVPLMELDGFRLLRVSAHVYNVRSDYERLAAALPQALPPRRS